MDGDRSHSDAMSGAVIVKHATYVNARLEGPVRHWARTCVLLSYPFLPLLVHLLSKLPQFRIIIENGKEYSFH